MPAARSRIEVRHVRERRADHQRARARRRHQRRPAGRNKGRLHGGRRGAVGRAQRRRRRQRAASHGEPARGPARARIGTRPRRRAGARARFGDRRDRRGARVHHAAPTTRASSSSSWRAGEGRLTLPGPNVCDQPENSGSRVRHGPRHDCRGSARRRDGGAAHRHRRARHPLRPMHAAAARALRGTDRRAQRRQGHRRALPRQPRAGLAAIDIDPYLRSKR